MDYRMILIEREGYNRIISFCADRPNEIEMSTQSDDIVFNLQEGKQLYEFLKGVYEDE